MKQDRFLTGILIGIAVLVVIALVVFFLRQNSQSYISEESPEGVVHNYVLAVLNDDYEKAYDYLADLDHSQPTSSSGMPFNGSGQLNNSAVDIGALRSTATASVEVALIYNPSDLFDGIPRCAARHPRQAGGREASSMPLLLLGLQLVPSSRSNPSIVKGIPSEIHPPFIFLPRGLLASLCCGGWSACCVRSQRHNIRRRDAPRKPWR
jgi:hypothetical protein